MLVCSLIKDQSPTEILANFGLPGFDSEVIQPSFDRVAVLAAHLVEVGIDQHHLEPSRTLLVD